MRKEIINMTNKRAIGIVTIVLGVLFQGLQLFLLPVLRAAAAETFSAFEPSLFHYFTSMPMVLALIMNVCVIVYGISLVEKDPPKQ